MAGADCALLERSGTASQQRFLLVGMLYFLVNALMFCAFFGLFLAVFEGFWPALFAAAVISFLIGGSYRLNMLNLEPPTLRDPHALRTKIATYIVRYFSVILFALFTAKCLETMLFGGLVDEEVYRAMSRKIELGYMGPSDGGAQFVEHLFQLHAHHPWTWLVTAAIVVLFLLPIVLKFRLNERYEYFSLKKEVDVRTISAHHDACKEILQELHRAQYAGYKDLPGEEKPVYREHGTRYRDESFNTENE